MSAYKPNILIVGNSGSGKSTSLRNLPTDKSVHVFDLERKGFPFRSKFEVLKTIESKQSFDVEFAKSQTDLDCKIIVIDSLTAYMEMSLAIARATQKGYDIYSTYNSSVGKLLKSCKSKDKIIVLTAIDEFVDVMGADGGKTTVRRVTTSGKEWEGKVEKEFLITLFTDVRKDKEGNMKYSFITNTDGICSAKTPMGMFPERLIENDVSRVIKAVNDYYVN